jgi:hypothetical protein
MSTLIFMLFRLQFQSIIFTTTVPDHVKCSTYNVKLSLCKTCTFAPYLHIRFHMRSSSGSFVSSFLNRPVLPFGIEGFNL